MRLRDLFMILLLCMTVGIVGTSCTGDDGEAGPPGPQGPPGEVTDADIPEEMNYYDFLKSWGSETGEITCSDNALMGMGPLPGGDSVLKKLSEAVDIDGDATNNGDGTHNNPDGGIAVNCDPDMFSGITIADINAIGDFPTTLPDATFTAFAEEGEGGLVFIKTGRGMEKSTEKVEKTQFNPPTEMTTEKHFVGGSVFADLNLGGDSTEPGERQDLYSQCGVGTAPPYLIGTWRAVRITETPQRFEADGNPVKDNTGAPNPDDATVTTKVCVVFDSLPGVTKCVVDINSPDDKKDDSFVALYDGMELMKVVKKPKEDATAQGASLFEANDIANAERTCSLFDSKDKDL